jgi:hypothetical protein
MHLRRGPARKRPANQLPECIPTQRLGICQEGRAQVMLVRTTRPNCGGALARSEGRSTFYRPMLDLRAARGCIVDAWRTTS